MNKATRNGNGAGRTTTKRNGNGNGNGGKNGNGTNGKGNGGQLSVLARRTTNVPAAFASENRRAMNNKIVSLSGSDFLSTVTTTLDQTVSDRILFTFPVTPTGYPGTRITQLAQLWERYRFTKFCFRYVPAVPVTVACQFAFYVDLDPLDDPSTITSVDELYRQAVAQTGSQQWNFNMPKTIEMARRGDGQMYYTGEDKQNLRFSQQGTGYLIQLTDALNSDGGALTTTIQAGSIFIDWAVELQTPQINPEATIAVPFAVETGTTDFTGVSIAAPGEIVELIPAIPNAYYILTLAGAGSPSGVGSFRLRESETGTNGTVVQFDAVSGKLNRNSDGSEIYPGYLLVQASADGVIRFHCVKSYDDADESLISSTLLFARDDIFATTSAQRMMVFNDGAKCFPRLPSRTAAPL